MDAESILSVDVLVARFGVRPSPEELSEIRALLELEIMRKCGDSQVMRILCFYLFGSRNPGDSLLVWRAKQSGFDAGFSIDVQFLCGAGLAETKSWLAVSRDDESIAALRYIEKCEAAGDFEDFDVENWVASNCDQYSESDVSCAADETKRRSDEPL